MNRSPSVSALVLLAVSTLVAAACGGGDGGTNPPAVASVTINAPGTPTTFQTLTRTVQLSAVPRDANGTAIPGIVPSWTSSNNAVATVSLSGLVTAAGNGTANITASAGGQTSTPVAITVQQYASTFGQVPATVNFGAIGSNRQLVATVTDSSGAVVPGAIAPTWVRAGSGASATVSAGGLISSIGLGIGDTAVGTSGTATRRVPIVVTQFITSVVVSPAAQDTLETTGRTKQYTAAAADSNANAAAGATFNWTSTQTGVATVGAGTGLATAVADGTTSITATAQGSTASASRTLVIRRYADVFTITPTTASITTQAGTQVFDATVTDSVGTPLPVLWISRATGTGSIAPSTGASTTATATGNGSTYIVASGGTRSDSAALTVSGQASIPLTATVTVGSNFFTSVRNGTSDEAIDTVAVGGTVTWNLQSGFHSVLSDGAPSFTSSPNPMGATYAFQFNNAGTYTYQCAVHGIQMTGRVIVR